jgi:hypothetical protein
VTVALCGSWDHEGTCRWPHHTSVDRSVSPAAVRVVYAVADDELDEVRALIEDALGRGDGWHAVAMHDAPPSADEAKHAARMADDPSS